ncbi:MAG: DUF3467 domain-containing protein [Candidatus Marinimicrobia bacterium]|jgi:hypothetical protein|nr:DUF3467 domain-containing protein [Candidatus Neomarinimicrobiota bacterium]MBT7377730.1 DUF3467 domain-containing protein [Candidatus Neomarinimicrobiota bacterium]
MDEKKKKHQHQIKVELDDTVGQGEYVNFAVVTHSPAEFVMDFIRVLPGMKKSNVKSRIIMAPMHAKTLMMALQDNITKFEKKFGDIKVPKQEVKMPNIKMPDDILPN